MCIFISVFLIIISGVSPVDGRYGSHTAPLRMYFSEFGLIKNRGTLKRVMWYFEEGGVVF